MPATLTNDIPPPTIMSLSIVHVVVFLVSSVGYGLSVFMHFIASLLPCSKSDLPSAGQVLRARRDGVAKQQGTRSDAEGVSEKAMSSRPTSPTDRMAQNGRSDRPRNASASTSVHSHTSSADSFVTSASGPSLSPLHTVAELPDLASHSGSGFSADDEPQNSATLSSPSSLGSTGQPSSSRGVSKFNVFKLKSRRVSDRPIPEEPGATSPSPGSSSVPASPPSEPHRAITFVEADKKTVGRQPTEPLASPGETFKSHFVNPFKRKSKRSKSMSLPPSAEQPTAEQPPSARRRFFRRPTFMHLSLASPPPPSSSKHSRHDSTSSVGTLTSRSSAGSPRGVPRTQPYAAPYFAPMPTAAEPTPARHPRQGELRSRKESSKSDSENRQDAAGSAATARTRAQQRRVSAPVVPVTPVAPTQLANCLGLTFDGEASHSQAQQSRSRHRSTVSEGALPKPH
ncbi:hypothetical protein OBBRIDRAFT_883683 [Obba rivulosa]|uniref:Uncharacterized protein n=1 Tax=Obba rivulosa TaxID=1052685 RepID=A0A8E2DU58_9APHY|nr:hypothetical protein OBBRIDRAFT_883683 [Obba rivulosa]